MKLNYVLFTQHYIKTFDFIRLIVFLYLLLIEINFDENFLQLA